MNSPAARLNTIKRVRELVDFVPVYLGNGKLRLEIRPVISEVDLAVSLDLDDVRVPGLVAGIGRPGAISARAR